ncbi:sulfite exporter TauE/SafE family protein [Nocardioides mesophilus]|uniref:sulfite exporter TauE/SafE family protein n=1 Tax=Nocardioides mesophilus TaxID=433659 RepID=UPI001FE4E7AF|nr:sulfite exporter TauE/SafE family protein [Nocardioides mesophilus]
MVAILAATLVVGAAVQGLVGLGLGLVSAPVAMLLEPSLMPDLLIWLAVLLPMVTLLREREEIDWGGLRWSISARVPGTVAGVALVAAVSTRVLGIVVGTMVLVSVLLTARTVVIPVNRFSLVVAGFLSGVAGTATSIGGPPMAVLLQHRPPRQIRTTLAVYFVFGAALSLVGLAVSGNLGWAPFVLAMTLTPCLLVGFGLSRWLSGFVPRHQVRVAVLVVCGASAAVLLVRSLF